MKTKNNLKKVAEELLHRNVVYRKKKGFGVPLAKWLTGELREFMLDYLSQERIEKQGIFHYPCVSQLINEQLTMKEANRELLWTLLVFQTWYERYIESPRSVCG